VAAISPWRPSERWMRGPILSGDAKRRAGVLLALVGGAVLSGCSDPTADFRKPELPTCQRFLRSRMRVPTSFHRKWYNVADFPVTRAELGQASGDVAQANAAPNPAIRRVAVNYTGGDGFGAEVSGFGTCYFPMTDASKGVYARDIDAAVTDAIHDNEQRMLAVSTGAQGVVSASCCTAPGFDLNTLAKIKPHRRNSVIPFGRKL